METMEFEQFLTAIGSLGPFQRKVGILLSLVNITCGFQILAIVFMAATPEYYCKASEPWSHSTVTSQTINGDSEGLFNVTNNTYTQLSECFLDIKLMGDDNKTESIPCTSWEYDRSWYELTIVNQWDLICGKQWLVATASSVFMVGFLLGSFTFGILSDRFGRKMPFLLTTLAQLVFGTATAFSPNYTVFVALRILNGVVTIGQAVTGFVLCMELVGNAGRSIFGFIMMSLFGIAYMLLSGLAYFVKEWWKLQLIVSIPSGLMLSFYFLVPESPRWLLLHNRKKQATDVMKTMAKMNGFPDMNVNGVSVMMDKKSTATYVDLLRTPILRIRTLSMLFIWMTNALVYYGLTFNTGNLAGNPYVNHAIGGAVEAVGALVCIWLFDKFGRRFSQFGVLVFCGVTLLAILAVPQDLTDMTITLAMAGKFMISASFSMGYIYTAEVFPTVVRNQAVGAGSFAARVGSISAPYIAQLGTDSIAIPSVTFGICSLTSAILILLVMPETKGAVLADTIQEGENFRSTTRTKRTSSKSRRPDESQRELTFVPSENAITAVELL